MLEPIGAKIAFSAPGLPLLARPGVRTAAGGDADWEAMCAASPVQVGAARGSDLALALFTSGSTGEPKVVLHTHRGLSSKALTMVAAHGLNATDAVLMPAPLSHISGLLSGVLIPAAAGMRVTLMERWDPDHAVRLVQRERISFMIGPPTFFSSMAAAAELRPPGRSQHAADLVWLHDGKPGIRRGHRRGLRCVGEAHLWIDRSADGHHVDPGRPARPGQGDRWAGRRIGGTAGDRSRNRAHPWSGGPRRARPARSRALLWVRRSGSDGRRHDQRMVPHRRPGHPRRRGMADHHRPAQGAHHPGRREHRAGRGRARARGPPRDRAGRRGRL